MVTIDTEPVIIEEPEELPVEEPTATTPTEEPLEELLEPPTPRKPGRPAGSKSKVPGKPRAPRVKKAPVIVEVETEPIRNLPDSRPIPTVSHDTNVNTNASRMLDLLAEHSRNRKNRKADLWRSWFN
jgi:hypothetical protein